MSDDPVKRRYDATGPPSGGRSPPGSGSVPPPRTLFFARRVRPHEHPRGGATSAGVSEATVYVAFGTKAALLDAAISERSATATPTA